MVFNVGGWLNSKGLAPGLVPEDGEKTDGQGGRITVLAIPVLETKGQGRINSVLHVLAISSKAQHRVGGGDEGRVHHSGLHLWPGGGGLPPLAASPDHHPPV